MRRAWIPSWHKNWRDSTAFSRPQGFFTLNPWNFCCDLTTLPPCMGGPKERLNSGLCWTFCMWFVYFVYDYLWMDGRPRYPNVWLILPCLRVPRVMQAIQGSLKDIQKAGQREFIWDRNFKPKNGSIFFPRRYSFDWPICLVSMVLHFVALLVYTVCISPLRDPLWAYESDSHWTPCIWPFGHHQHIRKDLTIWLVNLQGKKFFLSWFLLGATSWNVLQAVKGLLLMSFLDLNWDFRREVVKEDELRWHCMVFHESDGTVIQGPP